MSKSDLAYKLIRARLNAGLTQKQLAKKLGIRQQNVSQYEKGQRRPKIESLIKIAKVYDISVKTFIEEI